MTKKIEDTKELEKEETTKEVITQKEIEKKLKGANKERTIIISIVVGVLIIAFAIFGVYFYKTNSRPIAKFDGGVVTAADFNVYYRTFAPMLQYYGYPESIIPEQIANKAGIDMIILNKAKEANITLSEEDKKKVDDIFNDKEQVQQFIDEGIDVSRMKQLYYNDYTISAYIEKLKKDVSAEQMVEYIKNNANGEEVDLHEYNTSHILFKTIDETTGADLSEEEQAAAKTKAEQVLARAIAGEDFATLAKEFSEDTGTKTDGGKYTMYMDGKTYTEYADAVKTLEVGKVTTALVKSDAGYHIIKLDSKVENARSNNDAEREEFVDQDINKLSQTMNLNVDMDAVNKLVESITGKKVGESTDSTEDTTGVTNTDDTHTDDTHTSDDTHQE